MVLCVGFQNWTGCTSQSSVLFVTPYPTWIPAVRIPLIKFYVIDKIINNHFTLDYLVLLIRFELIRPLGQWILNSSCLPFHHSSIYSSYEAQKHNVFFVCNADRTEKNQQDGPNDRTWTCGILLPKQALYQTELHPDIMTYIAIWLLKIYLVTFIIFFLQNEVCVYTSGASNWNWTNDTGIFSPLLYQLSYQSINICLSRMSSIFSYFISW